MQLIERQMRQVRDVAEEAGRAEPDMGEARRRKAQELISACVGQWESVKDLLAAARPSDRDERRAVASVLRTGEASFASTLALADLVPKGYPLRSVDRLRANLRDVRRMIVLPLARQMAARDPRGRTADELADFILAHAIFSGGRPVLTPEMTAELPCPFDPEPAADGTV